MVPNTRAAREPFVVEDLAGVCQLDDADLGGKGGVLDEQDEEAERGGQDHAPRLGRTT